MSRTNNDAKTETKTNSEKYDFNETNCELLQNEYEKLRGNENIEIMSNNESITDDQSLNNIENYIKLPTELIFLAPIYILCGICNENFIINFINFNYITAECRCKLIKNCTLVNFIKKHSVPNGNTFGCKFHNYKKYIYYCKDCKFNLCEDCLKTKSKYNNKTGKHTKHETHTKIKLSKNRKTIKFISKALKNLSNKSYKNNNIINLISNLNQNYKEFKSYNAYKTLKNAAKFLKNLKKISPLSIDEGFELKYEELIKINSIEELRKNINKSNLIYKIEINGEKTKETMKDFSIFEGKDFSELKVLCLNEIKLKNISNLSSCSCPKLKRVDFECNLIGDDSINAFKNIKPQYINLFDNKITSIKILEVIKNNENLKEFYIGKNPLIAKDDEIMNCNNIYKYHLSQKIEKLGLTNLFDQKTVEFILNQGIENIKVLYIGSYGFSSFKIFENIVFNKLEALWARGNEDKGYIEDIKEINYINGKENIKIINLKQNKIKNIKELEKIIPSFPNLKLLNIEDNGIDKNICVNVLNNIKKIKGFKNFELVYN